MKAQKIIIIGATSGIGRRMAEIYMERGYRVGITGRRIALLQEIKQQFPQQAEYECFDVRSEDCISYLESLVNKLSGLDILVISAGTGEPSEELKWSIDKRVVDINVNGFAAIANWAFNYFIKQGYGQLATISSVAANRGNSWAPSYAASKAFQSIYFEGLAIKARKLQKASGTNRGKVHITCIEPGFVNTKMAHGGSKMFWVVPADKAARQIIRGIEKKKRKLYISRRWWVIVRLMRWAPYWLYRRFG